MILQGDALIKLRELPSQSVHMCVTSPPYYNLRNYGVEGQLGMESTPQEYVNKLVEVFREVHRALQDDGILFLNLGDSYNKKNLCFIPARVAMALQADRWICRSDIIWEKPNPLPESVQDRPTRAHEYIFLLTKKEKYFYDHDAIREPSTHSHEAQWDNGLGGHHGGLSHKGQGTSTRKFHEDAGRRNKRTVWTVTTKPFPGAHFATFPPDLIEPTILAGTNPVGWCRSCGKLWEKKVEKLQPDKAWQRASGGSLNGTYEGQATKDYNRAGAQNASDVKRRILEGMKPRKITWKPPCECGFPPSKCRVLDPFFGAGTVGVVATKLGRDYVGIELNPDFCQMAQDRISDIQPPLPSIF